MDPSQHVPINFLETDKGSEFINKKTLELLKKNNIKVYLTINKKHTGIVERANWTIRQLIERFITLTDSYNWVDYIGKIIEAYNNKIHRSTDVASNESTLENQMKKYTSDIHKIRDLSSLIKKKFKIGDKIRNKIKKTTFEKGATPNYSLKVYTIISVEPSNIIVEDSSGNNKTEHYMNLLKVKKTSTDIQQPSVSRTKLKKEVKIARQEKAEGISKENIVEGKRLQKPNPKYLD